MKNEKDTKEEKELEKIIIRLESWERRSKRINSAEIHNVNKAKDILIQLLHKLEQD